MKRAVMYGAGNIGRGFIGALLSEAGYEVCFVDVAESVVERLSSTREYPLRYISTDGHEDVVIRSVTAVNGNDRERTAECIAGCGIMATAVGARILPYIVDNLVAGLRLRWQRNGGALNIIICENLMDADKVLAGLIKDRLTPEEQQRFDRSVGLVEASIGRMVPVQTDEMKDGDPLRVCVERYGFLPVDAKAFKEDIPAIRGLVPYSPFGYYLQRKLYVHNMGHAVCAYAGDYIGLPYICQAIDVPDIRILAENAMLESALALAKEYAVPLEDIQLHISDLLFRFMNAALGDTCARVGGDPERKLAPSDRLIGAASLVLSQSATPAYIAAGAAGAVYRYIREQAGTEQSEEAAATVLKEVSKLDADAALTKLILPFYRLYLEGRPLADIRRAADRLKAETMPKVV